MYANKLEEELVNVGLNIGFAVRERINSTPRYQRGDLTTSVLKPDQGSSARRADAEGEEAGFEYLNSLSKKIERNIRVVVDPTKNLVFPIGKYINPESIYVYFDAVDGTVKVAGLGNDVANKIYRVGNNGCWATGIAFTLPTKKDISELLVKDFEISSIVDGNPTLYRSYPTNSIAFHNSAGKLQTYERDEKTGNYYKLYTSSQTNLGQATVLFDSFQAYDRKSAKPGSERFAVEIFGRLMNRNEGGAFDIVRLYANMGEVLRQCLERHDDDYKIEPQSVGSVTINENLPNLIPIRPVFEGAGGYTIDFDGNPIGEMKLNAGRPNVINAANSAIKDKLLYIVQQASI